MKKLSKSPKLPAIQYKLSQGNNGRERRKEGECEHVQCTSFSHELFMRVWIRSVITIIHSYKANEYYYIIQR